MYENPYLIEYLKAFITFDVMNKYKTTKVTISRIEEYVRTKQLLYTSGEITKVSSTFAEILRKAISNSKFIYSIEFLDMLSQCSCHFGTYKSWDDFKTVHGNHHNSLFAEQYRDKLFSELPLTIQHDIKLDIEKNIRLLKRVFKPTENMKGNLYMPWESQYEVFPNKRVHIEDQLAASCVRNAKYLTHITEWMDGKVIGLIDSEGNFHLKK